MRVRFAETDAMGIAHHASYLPWLEVARVEFLRAIGNPYDSVRAAGLDFAVAEAHVAYVRPAVFDEDVTIHTGLVGPPRATFELAYLLTSGVSTVATAVTLHACVVQATGRPTRPPAWLNDQRHRIA